MKSKKIVTAVSLIIFCVCIFFIMSNKSNKEYFPKNATLIYEETVSPNKEYVSDEKDIVYYTIQVYQAENYTIYVYADSNSPVFEKTSYTVSFDQMISEDDVQIKWTTLTGSTEATENDELGLANVTISKNGNVVNEKVISFVSKGIKAITDVIG